MSSHGLPIEKTILFTGGCGFIGSAVVRHLIQETPHTVVNVDALTYAGHRENVAPVTDNDRYHSAEVDITDRPALNALFVEHRPDAVMHLAAESHVDRSIDGPAAFLHTNVQGHVHAAGGGPSALGIATR